MSIQKLQAELEAEAFKAIGNARDARELHVVEALIVSITPDESARAELRRQIQMRREQWRLHEVTLNKVRLN